METQTQPRGAVKRAKFLWFAATSLACGEEQEVKAAQVKLSPISGLESVTHVQAALEANQAASSVQGAELVRVADELLLVRAVAESAAARTGGDTPLDTTPGAPTIAEASAASTKRFDALEGRLESAEQRLTASEQYAEALEAELEVAHALLTQITTCPEGTVQGNGYCVDQSLQEKTTWGISRDLCGERGARLCSFHEVRATCAKLGLVEITEFWVAELNAAAENLFAVGISGPCSLALSGTDSATLPASLPYFCCFERAVLAPK